MKPSVHWIHTVFRIACGMCFIGHGVFGFITKKIWCNYFAVFGIGEALAYQLMPVVGFMDILMGVMLLVYPLRVNAVWLIIWGLMTASMRPLSGEPFAELLERAGNFGAPVILLLLSISAQGKGLGLFQRLIPEKEFGDKQLLLIQRWLQFFGFLLLMGHGWLNLMEKPALLNQYTALGFEHPGSVARLVGVFECIGAFLIIAWPARTVILILLIWKITSEVLYPAYPVWEWVERGGSYGVLLGLWLVLRYRSASSNTISQFAPETSSPKTSFT